jgi:aspartate/methionine/tyrosine aminotransferase
VNFAAFQLWREQCLRAQPEALDCAETNLYRALTPLRPRLITAKTHRQIHRCDLARAWLNRYGFTDSFSRRALICRGVRHALSLIFKEAAQGNALLWIPSDVYPTYLELARATGIESRIFPTLPEPKLPSAPVAGRTEFLLVTNPWKPLGRCLLDEECSALMDWLTASPQRYLLVDCVYDLGVPFHFTTQKLMQTGRAILLHSVTKGWLWPKTFGVALLCEARPELESAFRNDPPAQDQLNLAEQFLSTDANLPGQVVTALAASKQRLLAALPAAIGESLLIDPVAAAPGCYFFPIRLPAEELLRQHRAIAIPASAFGANWGGSIITSLSAKFTVNGE